MCDSIPANLHNTDVDALLACRVAQLLTPISVEALIAGAAMYVDATVPDEDVPPTIRGGR